MDKFGRNYKLLIQRRDFTTVTILPPFTVEFDIHRNSQSSQNVGQIRVYNLGPENLREIRRNQFDTDDQRVVEFHAGYGDNLSLAFKGNITQAFSVREGNNMVTSIECFDGGLAFSNAVTDNQYISGTPQSSIIDSIVESMSPWGVSRGAIGSYPGNISKGNTYSGNSAHLLEQLTGNGFFIDNMKANCLGDGECILTDIPLINAESGLLGTPLLEQQYIHFDMLFEPSLSVGQQIILESGTDRLFNGKHKVLWIKHRGVISQAVCGDATTSVGCLPGTFSPILQSGRP